jgi:hypothetical protein
MFLNGVTARGRHHPDVKRLANGLDSQRERAGEREAGAPGEGDAVDGEVLDCGEGHRSPARLQPHVAALRDLHLARGRLRDAPGEPV